MKATKQMQKFFAIAVMALLLALSVPATSLGQSRSRGRHDGDWTNRNWSRHNRKKCGKFVNCHDARDGRWDNRGPRGDRVSNRWRNRNRNFDGNDRFRRRVATREFFRNRRNRH
jgi:hypothetical protein